MKFNFTFDQDNRKWGISKRILEIYSENSDKHGDKDFSFLTQTVLEIAKGCIQVTKKNKTTQILNNRSVLNRFHYPINMDWNLLKTIFSQYLFVKYEKNNKGFRILRKELELLKIESPEKLFKESTLFYVFKTLNRGLEVISYCHGAVEDFPPVIIIPQYEYKTLPIDFSIPEFLVSFDGQTEGSFILEFFPLIIEKKVERAHFTIDLRINFNHSVDERFNLNILLTFLEEEIKNLLESVTPIKTGLHTELQKFGRKPEPIQRTLFDLIENNDVKNRISECKIEAIGIEHTQAQNQALFAIQKLLDKTNYKGNFPSQKMTKYENPFLFSGDLPVLSFTPSQYLDAYGITKYETSRGKLEYSGEMRRQALQALVDLAIKQNLLIYKRIRWKNGKESIDRIETISPLIKIIRGFEALTRAEDNLLDKQQATEETDEKLKLIIIQPCPILIDQIDTYYLLKPANYYQEIKLLLPHASKYVYRFIDYLITQTELKRRKKEHLKIKISSETLAYTLNMNSWIKTRNRKRIKDTLNKCYKNAKELKYLENYKIAQQGNQEMVELYLNPDKFQKIKEIEKRRKQINEKS
jgi:hypothetical protein